jgi:hypothetical protein
LPRVGAVDQHDENGGGFIDRARSNPWLLVAIVAGAILLLAWIGWAIYVTDSSGATAGLGVVIAWPAMVVALALVALPFLGGYLLVRRLSTDSGAPSSSSDVNEETDSEDDEEPEDEQTAVEEDHESENEPEDAEKTAG